MVAALLGSDLATTGQIMPMMPWIILFGLVFFVPPNFLVLWAAQRIDSARVGILLMTEVLLGTLSAAMLSGDPFSLSVGIGMALIIGAALLEVFRR
jgi:drug/metabolite transporter (DMT)-like permease